MDTLAVTARQVAAHRVGLVAMFDRPRPVGLDLTARELEELLIALDERLDVCAQDRRPSVLRARLAVERELADALRA